MKKFSFLLIILFLLSEFAYAQIPVNDDCAGIVDLGFAPNCVTDIFTNVNATPSNIGFDNAPTCFNGNLPSRDVWFQFTCPDTLFDFRITLTGVGVDPIENPQFAVYRGDCVFDGLAELFCIKADLGETSLFLDMAGLTPGAQYFIRVSDYSATATPNSGTFNLCVDKIPPAYNVDQGGSTLCTGTLYDSGGADGDYGMNEDNVFTICPPQPSGCITFTLDYYNLDNGSGLFNGGFDILSFYDGSNTDAPLLASLNGNGFSNLDVAGGGGVCFRVQATNSCMTVGFTSDADNEFEGWKGHWECSTEPCTTQDPIVLNDESSNADIINALATPFTTITVSNINCAQGAYGTFSHATDNNELGVKKGLVLTSGQVENVEGPNDQNGAGTNLNLDGDAELDYLSAQSGNLLESRDACVVELDVFVATDELSFEYVFGSEEYPEFINGNYNDIFAFLVSGPGIVGDPNLNNAKNIAIIPNTNTPVEINSINNTTNWQYYRNNELGLSLQYDGLTSDYLGTKKTLTARTSVIPCNTYHLKLAVADRFDGIYDTGVFVSEIKGGTPDLTVNFASGIEYFVEACSGNQDQLLISLSDPLDEEVSFNTTVSGTATLGVDYTMNLPSVITFPVGTTTLSFPVTPISDPLVEGTETIIITLTNNFGCGTVTYKTLTIDIKDDVEVDINLGADTVYVCAGGTFQLDAQGAANYFWAPPSVVSNPFIGNPTITPTQDIWLEVTGTLATCSDIDSVFVKIISPQINAIALSNTNICQGSSVNLQAIDNVNHQGLAWSPTIGLNDPFSINPIATPASTTTYYASISIAGCVVTDSVTINVDTLFFPIIGFTDTTVCQNYPVTLASAVDSTTTTFVWTPAAGLNFTNISNPLATPDLTTTYTLTATSNNNYCTKTATVKVNVIAADVDINGDTYQELCLGDTLDFSVIATPAGAQVTWSPSFGLSGNTGNVKAFPDETTTFVATYNINNCLVRDSVKVRVDSLPFNAIRREKDKAVYCPGDTIYFISKTYQPADFPDITLEWLQFPQQLTPKENWNMVIIATTTHTYQRVESNHACRDTGEVLVNVSLPPTITIDASDFLLCPGEVSMLTTTVDPPDTKLEWEQSQDLSCLKCPNPVASPGFTTTFTVKTPDAPCPSQESITIAAAPYPNLEAPNTPTICVGGSTLLNNVPGNGSTYVWSTVPPSSFTSTETNLTVSPTENTVYHVDAVSPEGCKRSEEYGVRIAKATIDAGADVKACQFSTVTLNATSTGSTGAIRWEPTTGQNNANPFNPNTDATGITTYKATIYFNDEKCTESDTLKVNVIKGVEFKEFITTPDSNLNALCEGTVITLKSVFNPNVGLTYQWSEQINGDKQDYAEKTAAIKPNPGVRMGTVVYNVTATDANGCTDMGDIGFTFEECIFVPDAFTPNGDDVNDKFGIVNKGANITIVSFQIYSRWGQKVFEATPTSQEWNGTQGGRNSPMDVYIYKIDVKFADGRTEKFSGDVTLIR
jgi:gliding motility-associated-like protein